MPRITHRCMKADTTVEALAKMKPAFKKDVGTVTAGNASGINDGAGTVRRDPRARLNPFSAANHL